MPKDARINPTAIQPTYLRMAVIPNPAIDSSGQHIVPPIEQSVGVYFVRSPISRPVRSRAELKACGAFDIDVLTCPRCGGRVRLIGTVEDPDRPAPESRSGPIGEQLVGLGGG